MESHVTTKNCDMKVKDAIDLLQRCNPENELVIRDFSRVSIGPHAVKTVASITDGFDWDIGKTIITEEVKGNIRDLLMNKTSGE